MPNVFKVDPIYVIGYVREPGAQRVRGPLTIARAIALSGGFDASANREEIRIHRRDGTNQEVLFTFDAVESEEQPILLYPGDVLEVKKKFEINWNLVSTIVYILATGVSLVVNLTN